MQVFIPLNCKNLPRYYKYCSCITKTATIVPTYFSLSKRVATGIKLMFLLLLGIGQKSWGQASFVTNWDLATAGGGPSQLSFGTATGGTVNYTRQEVSRGSATGPGSFSRTTLTITGLPTGAVIRLNISPTNFQRININNGTYKSRLFDVEQWGSTLCSSMLRAFYGCNNPNITATDIPVFTSCNSIAQRFFNCTALDGPSNTNSWNTGAVINRYGMFAHATAFNQNIGSWNLNATVNLSNMLDNCGMDCTNYSATPVGWNANASCPTTRTLGATGRTYYPPATAAGANLVLGTGGGGKGCTITGSTTAGSPFIYLHGADNVISFRLKQEKI